MTPTADILFTTDRLVVRRMQLSDAAQLEAFYASPEVMRYLESPFTKAQTEAFVARAAEETLPPVYAVELKDGTLIGHTIFAPFDGPEVYEIGWVLGHAYWWQGYATELTEAMIALAKEMGLQALIIESAPGQVATAQLARRFGFTAQGERNGLRMYRLDL